jgi:hypothetical protein
MRCSGERVVHRGYSFWPDRRVYSNKDTAENQMLWCVKEYKRWFVLKSMQPHETIDDFVFWNETDADWYLDYLEL